MNIKAFIAIVIAYAVLIIACFGAPDKRYSDPGIAWWNDNSRVETALPKFLLNSKLYVDGKLIEIGFRFTGTDSGVITWRVKQ